ncbi:DUF1810 domain-containing protein [Halovulum sp. GXIMD14794]
MATSLERIVEAQDRQWEAILGELRTGRKVTHWMWYVFPQLMGLGRSQTARFYGLADGSEARTFLAHPVLGPRLRQCTKLLLALETNDPVEVFGSVDATKLRSCMTLFDSVSPDDTFRDVLVRFYDNEADQITLRLLEN